MPSLYKVEQGMYKNLDNALRNINRKIANAAKTFGKESEIYQRYEREVTAMFGKKHLRVDPKTGATQVKRTTKDIISAGVSMKRIQHVLDYMQRHSVKDEKKRLTDMIKAKRRKAAEPIIWHIKNAKKQVPGKITSADIKAEAKHQSESAAAFDEIMEYLYYHIDPKTMTGPEEAVSAYQIMTRESDQRTYAELREVASLMVSLRDRLEREGIPDSVPDRVQGLTSGEELY